MQQLLAQITNTAVPGLQVMGGSGDSGTVGANILGRYLAVLIPTSISIGALGVLLYMTMGAIQWITAGGDSGKIDKARTRIIQSLMGLAILTSITAAVTFIGPIFGIDILKLDFINQISGFGSGTSQTVPRTGTTANPNTNRGTTANPNTNTGGINLNNNSGGSGAPNTNGGKTN